MKTPSAILAVVLAGVAVSATRAASVGPTGYSTDFSTLPAVGDWSTRSIAGGASGAADATNDVQVTTNLSVIAASSITNQLLNFDPTNPPAASGFASWTAGGSGYVMTRPTGVRISLLMATLVNNTGSNVATINISYNLTVANEVAEQVLGQLLYYSFTGAAGSWNSLAVPTNSGPATTNINAQWLSGTSLYILFADDNGSGTPDNANEIDNFSVTTAGGTVATTAVIITSPTEGQNIVEGANFTVAATTTGSITDVGFYLDAGLVGVDTTSPYSVIYSNVSLGAHTITAVANGTVNSTPVHITIVPNNPPSVALTTAPGGTVLVGSNIVNTAVVTDGDPGGSTRRVEFYLDGVLKVTDTTSPFTYELCDVLVGPHTIMAVAVDQAGGRGTNSNSLTATNPADVAILIPNGSTWQYLDNGTDPRTNTPAWPGPLFDASSWSNGVAELGYGDASNNNRPETTVVSYGPNGNTKYATTYFRKTFMVTELAGITNLILRVLRDDGALVYLNGIEVMRTVTNAVVNNGTYTTPAVGDDGTFYQVTNIAPPYPFLVLGPNVVDVELHQDAANSSDISFDLMLWTQPGSPGLTITRFNDTQADISWPFPSTGFVLESENQLDNSWAADLSLDAPSGGFHHVTVTTSSGKKFYRLRKP